MFRRKLSRYSSFVALAVYFLASVHAYASNGNTIVTASQLNPEGIDTVPGSIVVGQLDIPGGTPASTTVNPNQNTGAPDSAPSVPVEAPHPTEMPHAVTTPPIPGTVPQPPVSPAPTPTLEQIPQTVTTPGQMPSAATPVPITPANVQPSPAGPNAQGEAQPATTAPGQPSSMAQPPAAPAGRPKPAFRQMPQRSSGSATATGGGSSFFFDDADVFEVIQTVFGEVLRVNYIIDPQVKGRVNFRTTTPIPRDNILPIMEIILRLNGIAVVEESGLYRIIPIGNISKEPGPIRFGNSPDSVELKGTAILQVVPLTFVNSTEMANILTPLLTQGGAIHDIVKRNMLIIADTDANVRRLLQVISMFDIDTYKDASRSKIYVYPLQNSKAEHVAKILQQVLLGSSVSSSSSSGSSVKTTTGGGPQTGMPGTSPNMPRPGPTGTIAQSASAPGESLVAPSTKIISDEVSNTLVIFSSPADYSVILGAIKQIDSVPRQVMIEAVVASVTLTDNLTYGLRWNLNVNAQQLKIKPFSRPITLGGPVGFQGLSGLAAGSFGYTATDPTGNVRLAIEADVTAGKAKILSAPHLLVADNREARIQVGSQIPIATSTTSSPLTTTGTTVTNTTTSTIQYKDVGTILKVKPQINDSGLISLELSQEVSSASTQNILGTDQFVITKNEVETNLVAQDGETIVIGGLVNETTSLSRSGIPVLSKLPVLGALFGQTSDENQRQELLILLTPRVVRNQIEADKMTNDYYELFKNVGKEINLEKHKKKAQTPQSSAQPPMPAAPEDKK